MKVMLEKELLSTLCEWVEALAMNCIHLNKTPRQIIEFSNHVRNSSVDLPEDAMKTSTEFHERSIRDSLPQLVQSIDVKSD